MSLLFKHQIQWFKCWLGREIYPLYRIKSKSFKNFLFPVSKIFTIPRLYRNSFKWKIHFFSTLFSFSIIPQKSHYLPILLWVGINQYPSLLCCLYPCCHYPHLHTWLCVGGINQYPPLHYWWLPWKHRGKVIEDPE